MGLRCGEADRHSTHLCKGPGEEPNRKPWKNRKVRVAEAQEGGEREEVRVQMPSTLPPQLGAPLLTQASPQPFSLGRRQSSPLPVSPGATFSETLVLSCSCLPQSKLYNPSLLHSVQHPPLPDQPLPPIPLQPSLKNKLPVGLRGTLVNQPSQPSNPKPAFSPKPPRNPAIGDSVWGCA